MSKIVIVDDEPQVVSYDPSLFGDLKINHEIEVFRSLPSGSREVLSRLREAHTAVITKATTKINNNIIENLPNLRHIAVFGIALDHIDLDAANRNKIAVTNIPDAFVTQLGRVNDNSGQLSSGADNMQQIRQYKFFGIYPGVVSSIPLDYGATDQIEEFQVTFNYIYWTVESGSNITG